MVNFRATRALINLAALAANLKAIRARLSKVTKVLTVVKANGYGHGAVACAKTLEKNGADWLGVATVEEGLELRDGGSKAPILVFGGTPQGAEEAVIRNGLTPAVFDLMQAKSLAVEAAKLKTTVSLHLKVDTGMTRLGIPPGEVTNFVEQVSTFQGVRLEGIFSHLAQADLANPKVTQGQEKIFHEAVDNVPSVLTHCLTHLANSAATVTLGNMGCGMVRPGLMLYGAYPAAHFKETIVLQPVMTLSSEIIALRDIPKGQGVSYGWSFVTKRPSRIAVVPIGYADGYPRALSNRASVLLHGRRAPVIGAVCMDLTMIDVTDIPAATVGDIVTLMGRDREEKISVEELAALAGIIPYEFLCGISARVPRLEVSK